MKLKMLCIGVAAVFAELGKDHDDAPEQPPKTGENLSFMAVTGDSSENKEWSQYTPSAQLNVHVTNEAMFGAIEENQEYILDISPAPAAAVEVPLAEAPAGRGATSSEGSEA